MLAIIMNTVFTIVAIKRYWMRKCRQSCAILSTFAMKVRLIFAGEMSFHSLKYFYCLGAGDTKMDKTFLCLYVSWSIVEDTT